MRLLPPDDAADVIQEAPEDAREQLLTLLDEPTRKEVAALLAAAPGRAEELILATTTSVRDTGLLDALLPRFEALVDTSGAAKPWECVGDVDESRAAVALAAAMILSIRR